MLLYYLSYHYIAKGLIITSLDKLVQQIENILHKQKVLEIENRKLQAKISKLKENELKLKILEESNSKYEETIKELTQRLEKILTI